MNLKISMKMFAFLLIRFRVQIDLQNSFCFRLQHVPIFCNISNGVPCLIFAQILRSSSNFGISEGFNTARDLGIVLQHLEIPMSHNAINSWENVFN